MLTWAICLLVIPPVLTFIYIYWYFSVLETLRFIARDKAVMLMLRHIPLINTLRVLSFVSFGAGAIMLAVHFLK